jgi:hypothetical protein
MLDHGTQTVLLKDLPTAHCRCGKSLTWLFSEGQDPNASATAECACGMQYIAWLAIIKVEGIDTKVL